MLKALGSGMLGACALTLIHETARRFIDDAPRMDVVGMRAIEKTMRAVDVEPPVPLHEAALVGEVVSNTLYYSLAGSGPRAPRRGLLLGAAAGLGAAALPPVLGLGRSPGSRWPSTPLMTIAHYTAGGPPAAAAGRALGSGDAAAGGDQRRTRTG